LISSKHSRKSTIRPCAYAGLLGLAVLASGLLAAQTPQAPNQTAQTASSFHGSVTAGEASAQAIDLSLDEAIQRGLKTNLGIILSGTQTAAGREAEPTAIAAALSGCERQGNRDAG
jgi:hypothetical protein